jgi:hypothetical protein
VQLREDLLEEKLLAAFTRTGLSSVLQNNAILIERKIRCIFSLQNLSLNFGCKFLMKYLSYMSK